jgi:hypothetical protein
MTYTCGITQDTTLHLSLLHDLVHIFYILVLLHILLLPARGGLILAVSLRGYRIYTSVSPDLLSTYTYLESIFRQLKVDLINIA